MREIITVGKYRRNEKKREREREREREIDICIYIYVCIYIFDNSISCPIYGLFVYV